MRLTDEQIEICEAFWGNLIATKGYGPITKGLISKFQRHLRKLLENEYRDTSMLSLNRIPLFPLADAIKSAKIDNPFPNEWIDVVCQKDGSVSLFRGKKYIRDISHGDEDLS